VRLTDANKPANTPYQRVMKQNPSGRDPAAERSVPDREPVTAPETSVHLGEQARGVGVPEDQGVTVGERTSAVTDREGAVTVRERTTALPEEAAGLPRRH
jgi:hypothetical protein